MLLFECNLSALAALDPGISNLAAQCQQDRKFHRVIVGAATHRECTKIQNLRLPPPPAPPGLQKGSPQFQLTLLVTKDWQFFTMLSNV
jgi:hypothetical protein